MNSLEAKVIVKWNCGLFVGAPRWQNLDVCEPDECSGEGEEEVDDEDFEEGTWYINCSECGQELEKKMGHFEHEYYETEKTIRKT